MEQKELSYVELERRNYIINVYAWMSAALAVTGSVSVLVAYTPFLTAMFIDNFPVFIGLLLAEVAIVGVLAGLVKKMSALTAIMTFFAYSILNGITLSVIFLIYTEGSIASTFFICSGTFAAMSAYGYFTKRDLTSVGNLCMMALFGLIMASIVNLFYHNDILYWATTYVGILIFVGLTAYDTQKIKNMNIIGNEGTEEDTKESIMGALELYLDFINLFLKLLRIFGKKR